MNHYPIHLTGQMPDQWREAFSELSGDLGLTLSEKGAEVLCEKGGCLAVTSDGASARVTWAEPAQFYRALSLLPRPLAACDIRQTPRFKTVGVMFDCSRNAVLKPETVRFFLQKMSLMGLNFAMLYTEDTYTLPEQPYFGYKRGRYTCDELKSLDDYAHMLGVELCPCIQTLGHLKRVLHWPALADLGDNADVLLADLDETYDFIDQMIRAASAPFRSRRIHIGMDEAYGVGLGRHLDRFGYEDPRSIIGRHLRRVLDITDKYGLEPMMWSDMYFHLDGGGRTGGGYGGSDMPSDKAVAAVDPRVTLVYWDYYHAKEEEYARVLKKHSVFPVPTVFAGGIWTWAGPAPAYQLTVPNTVAALSACMKAGVDMVFATCWGDNGAETNLLTALPGMQLYGEMTYTGAYDPAALAARFQRCCGADIQAFLDLSRLNALPDMPVDPGDPVDLAKIMLYQDPLAELFEADTAGLDLAGHYGGLVPVYARYAQENPSYRLLFDFYGALAHALSLKCAWHQGAAEAVRRSDRDRAAALAEGLPAAIDAVETLRAVWRRLWESTNRPNGFEVIDLRLGGVAARLATAEERMRAFANGVSNDIPELSEPSLPFLRRPDGALHGLNIMNEIVSPSTYDWTW